MMNYCISDMYEMPHTGVGCCAVQGGGEHCMYPGEGPGYGHYEPQPLHHPPCMEEVWPTSQRYSCSYAGGPPVFKSEFCSMEIPLSHYQYQPEYFPEIKPDFSHLQWMQDAHKKGMTSWLWFFTSSWWKGVLEKAELKLLPSFCGLWTVCEEHPCIFFFC